MRILFLMSEMSGYFYKCISVLQDRYHAEVHVICSPASISAPFDFPSGSVQLHYKNSFSQKEFLLTVMEFKPHLCFIAGWMDRDYMRMVRRLKKAGTVVVCGMDNPWNGSIRQYIATMLAKVLFYSLYDFMWVPGRRQYLYARKLGFEHARILKDLYVADTETYQTTEDKRYTKQLLFVGRLEKIKGVSNLYRTFSDLTTEQRNGWTLRIIGNGSLKAQLPSTEVISVENFKQPQDLVEETKLAGAFILPSLCEPWGLVVQEFARRKLPLLLSSEVGAGEQFLIPNHNGFLFDIRQPNDLKNVLIKLFSLNVEALEVMGGNSFKLAEKPNVDMWCATLLSAGSPQKQKG